MLVPARCMILMLMLMIHDDLYLLLWFCWLSRDSVCFFLSGRKYECRSQGASQSHVFMFENAGHTGRHID